MSKTTPTLDRREILADLFPSPDDYLFITGLAGSARDGAGLTEDGDNLYTMAGTMGAAVPMGLGVALSAPDSQVAVITGDGELLMNIGSLASVASMAPGNLSIVCIDNGCHGETGGQTGHTSQRTDLAKIADGAGIVSVMVLETEDQLADAATFLVEAPSPRFLLARVTDGLPTAYKRNMNPAQCRTRFRNAYLGNR
ncbi:MAG: thiamine pyrophosphate-binding protein [Alphaproteobacteria bacterium]|jgi:thiamine pyrophosphate-dependent acetolactate synthase large subunit-like protein|nr:thiamine pyrophosphate-binding protein [Alphaproteobacteria bacterium]MBT7943640.1 thiamine pyrophosphate-binding protein [Alphaproteobacteria bacterium]